MPGATEEGTRAFATEALKRGADSDHFRVVQGLRLSSIGLGTYLGNHDDETDELYRLAICEAASLGCNLFDSAINYRCQRSERAIGQALGDLTARGQGRDRFVIATKGGYLPFDGAPPREPGIYVRERFLDPGILALDDIAGSHAMAPRFLRDQVEASLSNLGLETLDIYYLHNPEAQLATVDRPEFRRRLRAAFAQLETLVEEGRIANYGASTWSGFRVDASARDYLSIEEVVGLAREVSGERHHFRFVQAPYSLAMPEIFTVWNHAGPLLRAAERLGVHVIASACLGQGHLTHGLPHWLGKLFRGLDSQAQYAIQFARSTPGVSSALVGMKSVEHVRENMSVSRHPPAATEDILRLFEVDSDSR